MTAAPGCSAATASGGGPRASASCRPRSTGSVRSWTRRSRAPSGSRRRDRRRTMSTEALPIPREVELKYLVHDEPALRQWLDQDWGGALDGVGVSDVRTVEVEDRYVDTARGALARAGFGARVRQEADGPFILTVKTASHERPGADGAGASKRRRSRALTQRVEVEGPADAGLDPDDWPPSAAQSLVNEIRGGARLRPLFTIAQRREKRTLRFESGAAELTLDWVAVLRDGRAMGSFNVLEV